MRHQGPQGNRVRFPRAQCLSAIVAVSPAAVATVARALDIRMPMQNGADRDNIQAARVPSGYYWILCVKISRLSFPPFFFLRSTTHTRLPPLLVLSSATTIFYGSQCSI